MTDTTPIEAERRAQYVAALRLLADTLENDESLPVPRRSDLQTGPHYRIAGDDGTLRETTQAERFAQLRDVATALGVDVLETRDGAREAARQFGPLNYFMYVAAERRRDDVKRVVPADEDGTRVHVTGEAAALLIGGDPA